jgi:hypothetical protein
MISDAPVEKGTVWQNGLGKLIKVVDVLKNGRVLYAYVAGPPGIWGRSLLNFRAGMTPMRVTEEGSTE